MLALLVEPLTPSAQKLLFFVAGMQDDLLSGFNVQMTKNVATHGNIATKPVFERLKRKNLGEY